METKIINGGKKFLAERRAKQLKGKVKRFFSKVFGRLLVGTSVGSLIVAGFFTGNALVAFKGF